MLHRQLRLNDKLVEHDSSKIAVGLQKAIRVEVTKLQSRIIRR